MLIGFRQFRPFTVVHILLANVGMICELIEIVGDKRPA